MMLPLRVTLRWLAAVGPKAGEAKTETETLSSANSRKDVVAFRADPLRAAAAHGCLALTACWHWLASSASGWGVASAAVHPGQA